MNGETGGSPRIRRGDFFMDTWKGVVQRLENLYSAESTVTNQQIPVLPVANLDYAERALQQKSSDSLSLPYIAIAAGGMETDKQSYNNSVLRRYGAQGRLSDDRSTYTFISAVPVEATFQVMFVTDDILTLLRMVDRWMANEIWGFNLSRDDYTLKIQIVADKALQIPASQPDTAGAEQFRQMTTLRVKTYSGYLWQIPSIYATQLDIGIVEQGADFSKVSAQDVDNFQFHVQTNATTHPNVA